LGFEPQDFRLSELVAKDGCAAVVVVNKWDRVAPKAAEDMDAYKADVKAQLRAVGWASVVCTTARCVVCLSVWRF
jgi:GTP-binding protein